MYPSWLHPELLSDPLVGILLEHPSLRIVTWAVVSLILMGHRISHSRPPLLEMAQLKRKFKETLSKAFPFSYQLLPSLFACLGPIAVIVLMAVVEEAPGPRWAATVDTSFRVFSIAAIVIGGLASSSQKSDLLRAWATALLTIGMAVGAVQFLVSSVTIMDVK